MVLNILARIHSWYLWKIHFLNFRDIGALLEQLFERLNVFKKPSKYKKKQNIA
jgi:hypothetical protein